MNPSASASLCVCRDAADIGTDPKTNRSFDRPALWPEGPVTELRQIKSRMEKLLGIGKRTLHEVTKEGRRVSPLLNTFRGKDGAFANLYTHPIPHRVENLQVFVPGISSNQAASTHFDNLSSNVTAADVAFLALQRTCIERETQHSK
jgi:hypothetical protein